MDGDRPGDEPFHGERILLARRALDAGAAIVGVNNRDLATFEVDLATAEAVAGVAREAPVAVAEPDPPTAILDGAELVITGVRLASICSDAVAVASA